MNKVEYGMLVLGVVFWCLFLMMSCMHLLIMFVEWSIL